MPCSWSCSSDIQLEKPDFPSLPSAWSVATAIWNSVYSVCNSTCKSLTKYRRLSLKTNKMSHNSRHQSVFACQETEAEGKASIQRESCLCSTSPGLCITMYLLFINLPKMIDQKIFECNRRQSGRNNWCKNSEHNATEWTLSQFLFIPVYSLSCLILKAAFLVLPFFSLHSEALRCDLIVKSRAHGIVLFSSGSSNISVAVHAFPASGHRKSTCCIHSNIWHQSVQPIGGNLLKIKPFSLCVLILKVAQSGWCKSRIYSVQVLVTDFSN